MFKKVLQNPPILSNTGSSEQKPGCLGVWHIYGVILFHVSCTPEKYVHFTIQQKIDRQLVWECHAPWCWVAPFHSSSLRVPKAWENRAKNPREPHEGNENPFEIDIQGHILRLGTWKPKKNTPKTPNLRSNHGPSLPNTVDGSEIRLASWLVVNPKKTNKVLSIPGGAGFLPSTVPLEKVFQDVSGLFW